MGVLLDDILCAVKPAAFVLAFAGLAALPAPAASIDALVKDANGAPLENAVVWAMPRGAVPGVMRTLAIMAEGRIPPTKESPLAAGRAASLARSTPSAE